MTRGAGLGNGWGDNYERRQTTETDDRQTENVKKRGKNKKTQ